MNKNPMNDMNGGYPLPRAKDSFDLEFGSEEQIRTAYGEFLKALRESLFDYPHEAARAVGKHRSSISRYERGASVPELGYLAFLLRENLKSLELSQSIQEIFEEEARKEVEYVIRQLLRIDDFVTRKDTYRTYRAGYTWGDLCQIAEEYIQESESGNFSDDNVQTEKPLTTQAEIESNLSRHLILRTEHFIDREQTLRELLDQLYPGEVVFVYGPAGMGKTALAAVAIREILQHDSARFPDGVYYYNFNDEPNAYSADSALLDIAYTYDVDVDSRIPARDAARRALRGKQLLLFFDGAESCGDLHKLLEIQNRCGVLITTQREGDALDLGITPIEVDILPDDYPERLLYALAGERAGDPTTAQEICDLIGRMTLAIYLVGRALKRGPGSAADFLSWLEKTPLKVLDRGSSRLQNIPLLLSKCTTNLSQSSQELLAVLGVLAQPPVAWSALTAGLDIEEVDLHHSLGELRDLGWLVTAEKTCSLRHILLHSFAHQSKEYLVPNAVTRLGTYYLNQLHDVEAQAYAEKSPIDAFWMHVVAVIQACHEEQEWVKLLELSVAIDVYLDHRGHWVDRQVVLDAGLDAAHALEDRHHQALFLQSLGVVSQKLGDWGTAIQQLEQSLQLYEVLGDEHGQAHTLHYLGGATRLQGELNKALAMHRQSLALFQKLNDDAGQAQAFNDLATVYHDRDEWGTAEKHFQQSLHIFQTLGDRHRQGVIHNNLCGLCRLLGRLPDAIQHGKESLQIFRDHADRYGEIKSLSNLGNVYDDQGHHAQAIEMYEASRRISEEIGYRYGESIALNGIALAHASQGQWADAIDYHQQDLTLCRDLGDRVGERMNLSGLADIYAYQGKWNEAQELYDASLTMAREQESQSGEARTLNNLGMLHEAQGRTLDAIRLYEESLRLKRSIQDQLGEGHTLSHLAGVYAELGRVDEALALQTESLRIAQSIEDLTGEAQVMENYGRIYTLQKNWPEASSNYETALQMYRQLGDSYGEARCYRSLGVVAYHQDVLAEAEAKYRESRAIFHQLGAQHDEGLTLYQLGTLYQRQNKQRAWRETWRSALEKLNPDSVEYKNISDQM